MQTRDAYLLAHFVGHVCASWLCKKPTAAPTLVWSCYIKCDIYNNSIWFNLLFVVHSSCVCIYLVVSSGKNKYDHNSRFWGSCIHSIIYARLLADRRINRPSCQKEIIGSSRSAHTQALPLLTWEAAPLRCTLWEPVRKQLNLELILFQGQES